MEMQLYVLVSCPRMPKFRGKSSLPLSFVLLPGRCEIYGDPHYISFQGVAFDFLEDCTYVLVEEQSPLHHLTIAVDNYFCVPGLDGSCAKGVILKYQNNTASLSINPYLSKVQVGCNRTLLLYSIMI